MPCGADSVPARPCLSDFARKLGLFALGSFVLHNYVASNRPTTGPSVRGPYNTLGGRMARRRFLAQMATWSLAAVVPLSPLLGRRGASLKIR
jgi:hypothetical protein